MKNTSKFHYKRVDRSLTLKANIPVVLNYNLKKIKAKLLLQIIINQSKSLDYDSKLSKLSPLIIQVGTDLIL